MELVGDRRNRRKDRGPHVANPVTFHEGRDARGKGEPLSLWSEIIFPYGRSPRKRKRSRRDAFFIRFSFDSIIHSIVSNSASFENIARINMYFVL